MRRVAIVLALLTTIQPVLAEDKKEPQHWIRALEAVQEEIRRGSDAAQVYLPSLINQIAVEIEQMDNEVILKQPNVRAILIYALSGGDSRAVRRLLRTESLPPQEEAIAKGALAYAEGRYSEASSYLEPIDVWTLDISLAPRVALTQAILSYKTDVKRALRLLDTARLLAVGTLVEEASLRRQIVLLAAEKDFNRFEFLAQKYLRSFGDSVYAGFFRKQFSLSVAGFDFSAEEGRLARIQAIVALLKEEKQRLELYLSMAEAAIGLGNVPLARLSATNGRMLSAAGTPSYVRSELYLAAADIVGKSPREALAALKSLHEDALKPSDVALRAAAIEVGREIMREPDLIPAAIQEAAITGGAKDEGATDGKGGQGAQVQPTSNKPAVEEDEVIASAKRVLAEADGLLTGKKK